MDILTQAYNDRTRKVIPILQLIVVVLCVCVCVCVWLGGSVVGGATVRRLCSSSTAIFLRGNGRQFHH